MNSSFFYHLLPHAFSCFVYDRYDTINSHLSQIFTYATVSITVVRFFFSAFNPMVRTFVTCFYVLMSIGSVILYLTLTPIFCQSGNKSKNDFAYRICKFVCGSYHWWQYFKLGDSSKNNHPYRYFYICAWQFWH